MNEVFCSWCYKHFVRVIYEGLPIERDQMKHNFKSTWSASMFYKIKYTSRYLRSWVNARDVLSHPLWMCWRLLWDILRLTSITRRVCRNKERSSQPLSKWFPIPTKGMRQVFHSIRKVFVIYEHPICTNFNNLVQLQIWSLSEHGIIFDCASVLEKEKWNSEHTQWGWIELDWIGEVQPHRRRFHFTVISLSVCLTLRSSTCHWREATLESSLEEIRKRQSIVN